MKVILKKMCFGAFIGASLLIPGLSGGTTAIILNEYQSILDALDGLFSQFKKSIKYLFPLSLGALAGFYICSFPLRFLLDRYAFEFSIAVIGVILGTVPLFSKKILVKPVRNIVFILLGVVITLLADVISFSRFSETESLFFTAIISFLSAVALILPGISLTYILIAFGYYERVIVAVNTLDILFLLKFFVCTALGVLLCAKALNRLYKKYPIPADMLILGMVLASVKQVFIRMPTASEIPAATLLLICGLFITAFFSYYEK